MAKDIIDNNGSITLQDQSTESSNARPAYQNAKTAIQYKRDRTAGFFDESTNQNTKTIYGKLLNFYMSNLGKALRLYVPN